MSLTSLTFLFFGLMVLLIYFVVPKKIQWVVLLVSSVIFLFYDNLNVGTVIQALVVLVPTYFLGMAIYKNKDDAKKSKRYLILGILIILGQLIYLKYTNLFLVTGNHILNLFKVDYQFGLVHRNSLVGISYYSLIMISYLTDIYRGLVEPQKNIFKCALFMSYFPILTSGPFIRYDAIENELYGKHKFDYKRMCRGLVRILWGVFKILVISQRLGMFVDTVYGNLAKFDGFYTIIAILFFTLQLYTNFSGSIDVIMGISEIIGIKLPENFTLPFFSRSITELWRNWHITLGCWLKDYIFYPLLKSDFMQNLGKKCKEKFGKKTGKKIPMYLSMFIMWVLIGAWHEGAYTFIIGSGILQFIYIFLEETLAPVAEKVNKKLGIDTEKFSYKLYQMLRTYLLFSIAMIFFRATSVTNAIHIMKNAFVWNPWVLFDRTSLYKAGLDMYDFRILIYSLIIMFVVQLLARRGDIREKLFKQNIVFRWVCLYSLIFIILIFGCYGPGYDPAAFIYRQF